jgi:transcriptional regulator with XRE-family HTH domain
MTNRSEVERLESAPASRADLAAARLASLVTGLIEKVETRSTARSKDVAEAMSVSPSRVSQLLSSDGNLRIATLARLLDGFGYELSLTARPLDGKGEEVTVPARGRKARGGLPAVEVRDEPAPRVDIWHGNATTLNVGFIYHSVEGEFVRHDRLSDVFPAEPSSPRRVSTRSPWDRK